MGSSCRGFFPVWIVGVPSLCSRSIGPCSVRLLLIFTMEFLLVFPGAILSGSSRGAIHRRRGPSHAPQPAPLSADAIDQLSRVFRIDKIPEVLSRHRTPPEYMTDLYGTLAYQNGITKQDTPFNSDVVRGLPDRGKLTVSTKLCSRGAGRFCNKIGVFVNSPYISVSLNLAVML